MNPLLLNAKVDPMARLVGLAKVLLTVGFLFLCALPLVFRSPG